MKKVYIAAASLAIIPAVMSAQSAFDAFNLSQTQLRGTARFMSMAGAFGALGGDISSLNQNPAGLGVYTGSEVAATLEVDMQRTGFSSQGTSFLSKQTDVNCNNFGYVGSAYTGSDLMPFFNWGVSYNRLQSFERSYRGAIPTLSTSMSNYIASTANVFDSRHQSVYPLSDLLGNGKYDPFTTDLPHLTVLGANTGLIYPSSDGGYLGLWGDDTYGDAQTWTRQNGYVDQYDINFGGNFADIVYWGLGFGIQDIRFVNETYYDESLADAYIPTADYLQDLALHRVPQNYAGEFNYGTADWNLQNYQQVTGSGFNMKFGVIVKPVNELRIGLAVHTPTWYKLTYGVNSWVGYNYYAIDNEGDYSLSGNESTNDFATPFYSEYSSRIRTPWKLIGSVAGVIGQRFIISADYEYDAYPDMNVSIPDDGTMQSIMDNDLLEKATSRDIEHYYKATSTLRLGAEFRINRNWSARLGYSFKSAPSTKEARSGYDFLFNSGTQTVTELQDVTRHYTAGIGYRYKAFYLDAAFVHQTRDSQWQAFTACSPDLAQAPDSYAVPANAAMPARAKISDTRNQLVFTMGFKF